MRSSSLLYITLACIALLALAHVTFVLAKNNANDNANSNANTNSVIDQGSAHANHQYAIELAQQGNLKQALPYFKLAVQSEPYNAHYINNQAVTLLRLQRYKKAKALFEQALTIQPGMTEAIANLRDLKSFAPHLFNDNAASTTSSSSSSATSSATTSTTTTSTSSKTWTNKNRNERMPIPRLTLEQFYLPQNKEYRLGQKPFILTGVIDRWNVSQKWTLNQFKQRFGHATADFYPHNMPRSNVHPYLVPLNDAIREFQQPSGQYPRDPKFPGTYIQWNMNIQDWDELAQAMKPIPELFRFDEMWLRHCFPNVQLRDEYSKRTHWRMMLIGTEGAGMFNHQDVLRTASWQAQFSGAKLWHLCSPTQNFAMYRAGDVDCFDPDYSTYPNFARAQCYEGVVYEGDFIYYPADYWHQTRNLKTPSMSITSTIMDHNNWQLVRDELRAECYHKKYRWNFSSEMCESLERCYDWLQHKFEIKQETASDPAPYFY